MAYSGPNPPSQLELAKMISALDANNSVAKGCRFVVRINLSGLLTQLSYAKEIGTLVYACDAAEFPGRGFQTTEVRYYGPKQMMPGNTTYGDGINLSFICRSKSIERQFFDDWMDIINPPTSYHFKYPNQYYSDIEIFHFAEYGSYSNARTPAESIPGLPRNANPKNVYQPEALYGWKLYKAWPMAVSPQQVTWAETDILRLQVTFAYKNWKRQGDEEQIAKKISQ